jgi:hypothetical protein
MDGEGGSGVGGVGAGGRGGGGGGGGSNVIEGTSNTVNYPLCEQPLL